MNEKRRHLLAAMAALVAAPPFLRAQENPVLEPTSRDWSGAEPVTYPDPDVLVLDDRFQKYRLFNTPIRRLYTGTLWAEGPAWNGVGRYLVFSDIPQNVQHRWLSDDGEVTTMRKPSGYSNGNTFDFAGRQISCEHGGRRVVRYEPNGTVSVIADSYLGKRLNSPNDAVVHPDGSIWFTDPTYGINGDYEGSAADSETATAVYRVDPTNGQVALLTDEVSQPNGLCFSPDYSRLYVADTGDEDIKTWNIDRTKIADGDRFSDLVLPGGGAFRADGIRCDVDGNVWAAARPGVQIIAPDAQTIGMIRLPELSANLCFGGSKRNRLFVTASQSLYSVYVGVAGAHIC